MTKIAALRILVLNTDGTARVHTVPHTLDTLQAIVGGLIEPFELPPTTDPRGQLIAICNEEGTLDGLPPNPFSHVMLGPPPANLGAPVSGQVLICGDVDGEFVSLTDEQIEWLSGLCAAAGVTVKHDA